MATEKIGATATAVQVIEVLEIEQVQDTEVPATGTQVIGVPAPEVQETENMAQKHPKKVDIKIDPTVKTNRGMTNVQVDRAKVER